MLSLDVRLSASGSRPEHLLVGHRRVAFTKIVCFQISELPFGVQCLDSESGARI